MAVGEQELLALSATAQRDLLVRREISSLDLVNATLGRIEAINPSVNALIWVDTERALAAAREADDALAISGPIGPLHGLPIAVKDADSVAGMPTTCGSPLYRDHVAERDGSVAAQLRAAGAIIIGKTNIPEFSAGANTRNPVWGATGNPYAPEKIAGGSSGGSAAALACGMASLCTGTDSGGSLRIPASMCGVVGMRPTAGRIGSERRALGWSRLSVQGPMGRSVTDVGLMLSVLGGLDAMDPLSFATSNEDQQTTEVLLSDMDLIVSRDFGVCDVDPLIAEEFDARIARIGRAFASVRPFDVDCSAAKRCFEVLRGLDFLANFGPIARHGPDWISSHILGAVEQAQTLDASNIVSALRDQTLLFKATQRAIGPNAILVCPVTPVSPFPWTKLYPETVGGKSQVNYLDWLQLTYIPTVLGSPAIAIPAGLDATGMPFGLQLVGRHGWDFELLAIAQAVASILEVEDVRMRPTTPDLHRLIDTPGPLPGTAAIIRERKPIEAPLIFPPPAV